MVHDTSLETLQFPVWNSMDCSPGSIAHLIVGFSKIIALSKIIAFSKIIALSKTIALSKIIAALKTSFVKIPFWTSIADMVKIAMACDCGKTEMRSNVLICWMQVS